MPSVSVVPILVTTIATLDLAGCGSGPAASDAHLGDARLGDARPGDARPGDARPGDARPGDANPVDGPLGCDPDQVCFAYHAVDGVTNLPPGRLVIAWLPPEGGGSDPAQVGYDGVWTTDVTALDLAAITPPDAAHQIPYEPCGSPAHLGDARGLIGTNLDANTDGLLSIEELKGGSIYGIFQAVIIHSDVACPPNPDVPSGILMGIHVYDDEALLDGVPTEFQTCSPGTAACDELNDQDL